MAAQRTLIVRRLLWPMATIVCLNACTESATTDRYLSGSSMGTSFTIEIVDADIADRRRLQADVEGTLSAIENRLSTYLPSSELSALNASRDPGWITISRALCSELEDAVRLSAATGGAFDPTIGPLVDLWGFGAGGIVVTPPPAGAIEELRSTVGYEHLELDCSRPAARKREVRLAIDLSGYAKGYAVDRLTELLEGYGARNFLVELGGELKLRGNNAEGQPWSIAIERPPPGASSVQSIVRLTGISVATSGDYRNFFEHEGQRYSHTIDPRTGRPVSHTLAAVTVLAESAAEADAMATALLVLGPKPGLAFAEREELAAYFLLRSDDGISAQWSTRFARIAGFESASAASPDGYLATMPAKKDGRQ